MDFQIPLKNPLSFRCHLHIKTSVGTYMPVGYLTRCGLPVLYGTVLWQFLHFDWALQPKDKREPHPVV